jgi:hypothetical protein
LPAEEYLDQVTLAPGLVISNQSIGAARIVEGEDFRGGEVASFIFFSP